MNTADTYRLTSDDENSIRQGMADEMAKHPLLPASAHDLVRAGVRAIDCVLADLRPIERDWLETEAQEMKRSENDSMNDWTPEYSPWRHGGWYVDNVQYPSGAVGCVSRNYPDKKWRIVCDRRKGDRTYPSRDAAARAERSLAMDTEYQALST